MNKDEFIKYCLDYHPDFNEEEKDTYVKDLEKWLDSNTKSEYSCGDYINFCHRTKPVGRHVNITNQYD